MEAHADLKKKKFNCFCLNNLFIINYPKSLFPKYMKFLKYEDRHFFTLFYSKKLRFINCVKIFFFSFKVR